jgi:hypothetical protein
MPFALFEMKLVLAGLLSRLHLDIAQDVVRPTWRGAFLTPSHGLQVIAHPIPPSRRRRRDLEPEHAAGTATDDA